MSGRDFPPTARTAIRLAEHAFAPGRAAVVFFGEKVVRIVDASSEMPIQANAATAALSRLLEDGDGAYEDVAAETDEAEALTIFGFTTRACVAARLALPEEAPAALVIAFDAPRSFSDADLGLLAGYAEATASLMAGPADGDALREASRKLAHDLRTPLGHIMGFSELMRMEAHGPIGAKEYSEYADIVHEAAAELVEMVDKRLVKPFED